MASPNVFTLDFGDYQDQYYSVQTTEGEHIHQLIAGYIDIILKHRDRKEHIGDDGDEGDYYCAIHTSSTTFVKVDSSLERIFLTRLNRGKIESILIVIGM